MDSPVTRQACHHSPAREAQFHIFGRVAVRNKRAVEVQKKANVSGLANPLGNLLPTIEKIWNTAASLIHIECSQPSPLHSGRPAPWRHSQVSES
jgi:hypothetical protein